MGKTTPGETEGQQVLRGQEPWAPQTHLFPGERDLQPGSTSSPRLAPTSASNPGLYSRIAGQRSLVLVSHAGGKGGNCLGGFLGPCPALRGSVRGANMPGAGGLWGQWRSRPPSRTLAVGLASVLAGPCRRYGAPVAGAAPPSGGLSYLVGKIVRHHLDPRFNCSSTQVLGEHPWQGTWSWGALGSPERAAVTGGGCPGQPGPAGPPGAAWSMPPGSLRALRRRCWARSYLRGGGGWRGHGAEAARTRLTPTQSAPAPSGRPRPCRAGRPHPSPGR